MTARFRYIAAHEAAHAVTGYHLGLQILKVEIGRALVNGETIAGGCTYAPIGRRQKLAMGIMLAAGIVSDRITRAGTEIGSIDRQLMIGAGFRDEDCRWLEAVARTLLRGPLAVVWREVTDALVTRDLTAKDIRNFCGKPLLR